MNTTRRLAATALPMLLIAGATRAAFRQAGEPLAAEACGPDADVKGCATGKGAEGAARTARRFPARTSAEAGDIPAREILF